MVVSEHHLQQFAYSCAVSSLILLRVTVDAGVNPSYYQMKGWSILLSDPSLGYTETNEANNFRTHS